MADQEPPLVNLLSTEAKAKSVEGHNTIKEVSRRIQDDGYRGAMAGGMWLWSVIGVLLAVPLVVVILKRSKQ